MTKSECENLIAEKVREAIEIYKEYNPEADYLSMSVRLKGKYMEINNEYWGADSEHPIEYFEIEEDEE